MEREALLVADVDTRDRPIAVRRQDPLHLGIDTRSPGNGGIVRRQWLAVRPAQSRAQPVGHVYRAGSTIPFNVAVLEGRHAFHQVGYRLQVGVQPHEARIEQGVQLRCRDFFVEEWRKVGRALPVADRQRAALVARGLCLILRRRRTGAAQRDPMHRWQGAAASHEWQHGQGNERGPKRPPAWKGTRALKRPPAWKGTRAFKRPPAWKGTRAFKRPPAWKGTRVRCYRGSCAAFAGIRSR